MRDLLKNVRFPKPLQWAGGAIVLGAIVVAGLATPPERTAAYLSLSRIQ